MEPSLALNNDAAQHWLRRALPVPPPSPAITSAPMSDRKLFLLTFCAGFLAFYGFIA